ncbi:hypothetical protein IFM89_008461 [Coptis chinensis]|uniref:Uncharacterized protein n=1 Tax=Coptis chinensis TaxID=261450 RepID=A0A835H242_9MAGN|nr:hypothetical protein IFM89_008461 [Coptis chinensis]
MENLNWQNWVLTSKEIFSDDPPFVEAYHGLAMTLLQAESGELEILVKIIENAMEEFKKETRNEDLRDFQLLFIEGKYLDALKVYQELVKEESVIIPLNPPARKYLSGSEKRKKKQRLDNTAQSQRGDILKNFGNKGQVESSSETMVDIEQKNDDDNGEHELNEDVEALVNKYVEPLVNENVEPLMPHFRISPRAPQNSGPPLNTCGVVTYVGGSTKLRLNICFDDFKVFLEQVTKIKPFRFSYLVSGHACTIEDENDFIEMMDVHRKKNVEEGSLLIFRQENEDKMEEDVPQSCSSLVYENTIREDIYEPSQLHEIELGEPSIMPNTRLVGGVVLSSSKEDSRRMRPSHGIN